MSIKNKNKRNFFKISSLIIFSLITLDFNRLNFYTKLKNNGIKFVKKNKKIWILNQDDFE
tara:strand:- start:85 stop:264 length:180 start_codon:yes stop_codon:yes gene_type:complete